LFWVFVLFGWFGLVFWGLFLFIFFLTLKLATLNYVVIHVKGLFCLFGGILSGTGV
jgi:hypothetical protein